MQEHDSRAVPAKATSRRTFLKGALIAAATPAVALAPMRAETLGGLIAYHDEIWTACKAADDFIHKVRENAPAYPAFKTSELGWEYHSLSKEPTLLTVAMIDNAFDKFDRAAQWHIDHRITPVAAKARLQRQKADRLRAKAIFSERVTRYEEWERSVGIPPVREEWNRLSDLEIELDERIMNWPLQSLDEARQVAGYLSKLHGDKLPTEEGLRLVATLLA